MITALAKFWALSASVTPCARKRRRLFGHYTGLAWRKSRKVQSGIRAQIAIKIFGDDLNVLRQKGRDVLKVMQGISGVADLALGQQINVPQVIIKQDLEKAVRYGISTLLFPEQGRVFSIAARWEP